MRSLVDRSAVKCALAACSTASGPASSLTLLIYHRVSGGTRDERDVSVDDFGRQMAVLRNHRVLHLDNALDELAAGDGRPKVVITFDDGFADVATTALPVLAQHELPFTLYLSTRYVGADMHWEGSTASASGPAVDWGQLHELLGTGLCTIGNHTHSHVRPEQLDDHELDLCTKEIEAHLGVTPHHFAYPWGVRVPHAEDALRRRFRSAATGELGRNHPGTDPMRLRRVPVRGTDPLPFFAAKLHGRLLPERTYGLIVGMAKRVGVRA